MTKATGRGATGFVRPAGIAIGTLVAVAAQQATAATPPTVRIDSADPVSGVPHNIADTAPAPGGVPALYTALQADRGAATFRSDCSQCHGKDLTGRSGPALTGPDFGSARANVHVGDIFAIVAKNMPATNPGSLPAADDVDIMAFLLRANGYPAGRTALTYDGATRSTVPFVYHGK